MKDDKEISSNEQNVDITLPVSEENLQDITGSAYYGHHHDWDKTDTIVTGTVLGTVGVVGGGLLALKLYK